MRFPILYDLPILYPDLDPTVLSLAHPHIINQLELETTTLAQVESQTLDFVLVNGPLLWQHVEILLLTRLSEN